MRIVGGRWTGKGLVSPSGRVRPTTEELRAVWMELLAADLEGARTVDLFAGSGSVGIEALSRGAASCDFVENDPAALHSLKANIALIKAPERTRLFKRDAIPFVERLDKIAYDIAFADPPYGSKKLDRIVNRWIKVQFSTLLAVEHAPDHSLPINGKRQRVGDSVVTVFRKGRGKPRAGARRKD